jgi:hypothetical protein
MTLFCAGPDSSEKHTVWSLLHRLPATAECKQLFVNHISHLGVEFCKILETCTRRRGRVLSTESRINEPVRARAMGGVTFITIATQLLA